MRGGGFYTVTPAVPERVMPEIPLRRTQGTAPSDSHINNPAVLDFRDFKIQMRINELPIPVFTEF